MSQKCLTRFPVFPGSIFQMGMFPMYFKEPVVKIRMNVLGMREVYILSVLFAACSANREIGIRRGSRRLRRTMRQYLLTLYPIALLTT